MLVPFTLRCRAAALRFSDCSTVPKSREPAVADSLHLFVVGVARSWADVIPALAGALPGWPCAQAASGFPCFCRNVCCICGSSYPSIRTCRIRCPRIASVLSAWPLPLTHPLSSAPVRIASVLRAWHLSASHLCCPHSFLIRRRLPIGYFSAATPQGTAIFSMRCWWRPPSNCAAK